MRIFAEVVVLTAFCTTWAHAQGAFEPQFSVVLPHVVQSTSKGEIGRAPLVAPRVTRRCCSVEGALIGAAIGATAGFMLTRNLCDAGDCTSSYIKSMVILGGIGAGLGVMTARPSRRGPVTPLSRGASTVEFVGRLELPNCALHPPAAAESRARVNPCRFVLWPPR
jgi:hypothetical protein